MLKALVYLGLTAVGIVAALFSPVAGAVACIEAYLLNPVALNLPDGGFRYQLWTTVAFLVGLLLHRPRRLPRFGHECIVLTLLWCFVAVCALSSSWAVVTANQSLLATYQLFKILILATTFLWVVHTESDLSTLITACVIGVFHAGLLHTFGARLGYVSKSLDREYGVLVSGQSQVMVMFVPLLVLLILNGSLIQRLLAAGALLFALNSIVKSYQRTSFVALVFEGMLLMLFLPRRIILRLLPILMLVGVVFVLRLTPENYWQWMRTIEDPTHESSAASRFVVAQASWQMFQDYPLGGVGYYNYQYVSPRYLDARYLTDNRRSSHNSYFTVLCETGLLGFIPWALAIIIALVLLRQVRKGSDLVLPRQIEVYAMGIEIGLYGWLVTGLFGDQSGLDPAYWFLGLTVVVVRSASYTATEEQFGPDVAIQNRSKDDGADTITAAYDQQNG